MEVIIENKKLQVPIIKEELTLDQYQKIVPLPLSELYEKENWLNLFNILAGTSYTDVDLTLVKPIFKIIDFCIKGITFDRQPIFNVVLNGRELTAPELIGELSIGQAIAIKQSLTAKKYLEEGLSIALAIYLQPIYDNKPFDLTRAKELEKDILKLKAYTVFGLGYFIAEQAWNYGVDSLSLRSLIKINLTKVLSWLQLLWQRVAGLFLTVILVWLSGMRVYSILILTKFTLIPHLIVLRLYSITKRSWMSITNGTLKSINS